MQNKQQRQPFSLRAVNAYRTLTGKAPLVTKDFVQPLSPLDGWSLNGTGRMNQYTTKPEQLAANISWVYACNEAIVNPCAAVQLKLMHKKKDGDKEEVPTHDILDLLATPNYAHTGEQLFQLHYSYMNLAGESYIRMIKDGKGFVPSLGQLPDALQILPTNKIQFKLGDTYLKSVVKIDRQEYPIDTVIRDFNPDPANPYYGRSVIAASAPSIDMDRHMVEFNRRKFANDATPSLVFQTNEQLEPDAHERLKRQINDEHTGTENAGKPWVVEGGGKVTAITLTNKDLEYLGGREFSMKEILSMFRVSPGMLGQVENVNRANLEAGFYVHAVINTVPRVRQFVRQLNASFVKVFDPTLELDFVNPVPEDVAAKLDQIKTGVGSWLTTDEGRDAFGMKPLPDGIGEHVVIIAGKTPITLDNIVNPPEPEPETAEEQEDPEDVDGEGDDDPDESPSRSGTPEKKKTLAASKIKALTAEERQTKVDAKIAAYNDRAEIYQQAMTTVLQQQFDMQRAEILSNTTTVTLQKAIKDASKRQTQQHKRDWLAALLAWPTYNDTMRKALAPILYALIVETGQAASQEIGLEASQFDGTALEVLNYYQHQATKMAEDVNAETEKQLRASLGQGIDAGESDNELAARVEEVMGKAVTYRADRIARTETARAQGFADITAWTQAGTVEGKEWVVQSGNPCPFCESLDGVIIPLADNFYSQGDVITAGGKSMTISYGDVPSQPVHMNCQCGLFPVMVSL